MNREDKIYVAGHNGMVGSALVRKLRSEGFNNLVLRSSAELDLRNQSRVDQFFETEKPDYVFLAAAKVGGIVGNNIFRADFLYENLMIESNIIHQSYLKKVKKLLFLGSSCIYPRMAPQPLKEEYLLSGFLEHTNEPYAIAKIAGIKLCENYRIQYGCNFISAMPTNLYGANDNYDLTTSHVIPALIRKFYEGKLKNAPAVEVWGSGNPRREFLHVDDVAEACYFLMEHYSDAQFVNVGSGEDLTVSDLAKLIKSIVGFEGEIVFDSTKPDGTPRKLLDVSKLSALGWTYKIKLEKGLQTVFEKEFLRTTGPEKTGNPLW
jgi:GDP-L-fucose synthase